MIGAQKQSEPLPEFIPDKTLQTPYLDGSEFYNTSQPTMLQTTVIFTCLKSR